MNAKEPDGGNDWERLKTNCGLKWRSGCHHCLWLWILAGFARAGLCFSFEEVQNQARDLASRPFESAAPKIPDSLLQLNYDQYRRIQFKHAQAWWRAEGLPFQVEFFIPGSYHRQVVSLNEIIGGKAQVIPFEARLFDIDTNQLPLPSIAPGYAGFRLEYSPANFGELAAFLDASYFRMIGRGQNYGASARGLAINTTASGPEEFPAFKEFWLQRPGKSEMEFTLFALLDSPHVAGAYQFVIHPGAITTANISMALFPRQEINQLGIAPMTSMFFYDEDAKPPKGDGRPQVHDSDGLLIHNGHDEWLWRPLKAGKTLRDNLFMDENPSGFGLMQRERDFTKYRDSEARYEDRPSIWIQPRGNWGKGAVELVQLPAGQESADNIVAFWVPGSPPKVGDRWNLAYDLAWMLSDPVPSNLGHVVATKIERIAGSSSRWQIAIDFAGLPQGPALSPYQPEVDFGTPAPSLSSNLSELGKSDVWRLTLEVSEPKQPMEIRALLKARSVPVTEIWTDTWYPQGQ